MAGIPGLSYRGADGKIHHIPDRKLIQEISTLPAPGRHLLKNLARYTGEDLGLIMTSRGCPYNCRFCSSKSIWTRRTRFRALDDVANEIDEIQSRYNVSYITFKDDSFTLRRERILDYCRLHRQRFPKLPWECVTRLDLIDADLLATMRAAGCVTVKVGVESGSARMLAAIDKGEGLAEMRHGARLLRQSGMFWSAYFIIGLPGETEADQDESVRVLGQLAPDFAAVGCYEPFPGTPMFADGLQRGLFVPRMTADEILRTPPGEYYLKTPGVRSDLIASERFAQRERHLVGLFAARNRRVRAVMRRLRARVAQYRLNPRMFFRDAWQFVQWYHHA